MTTSTAVLWLISFIFMVIAWRKKDDSLKKGLILGWKTFIRNTVILVIAFILIGFVNVLSPTKLIQDWIGPETGFQGLVLSEFIGMLLPGGPYAVFPLISVLYSSGAGLAPAITLITSWSTQALLTLSFEIPFMGWRFSAIRWGMGLGVPILAGAAALLIFG